MIRLLLRCGHELRIDPDKVTSPACWCGESQVARTLDAPRPRFVGHARGPQVHSTFLGATAIDVTTDGPLVLAPADDAADDGDD